MSFYCGRMRSHRVAENQIFLDASGLLLEGGAYLGQKPAIYRLQQAARGRRGWYCINGKAKKGRPGPSHGRDAL